MLRAGEQTKPHRHTSSAIYHVFKERASPPLVTRAVTGRKAIHLLCLFGGWHHHGNPSPNEAILFVMNDRPIMEAFGFHREEGS
jgi:gentisate 1,2-dioxygenase